MPHQVGLILGQIPHGTELNVSNAQGLPGEGMGRFGIEWYINSSYLSRPRLVLPILDLVLFSGSIPGRGTHLTDI